MICIHLHLLEFMRKNKALFTMMATPMRNMGCKQQQHDDKASLVSQFINEEISVTMKKWSDICHSHVISKYNANNVTCHQNVKGSSKTEKANLILYWEQQKMQQSLLWVLFQYLWLIAFSHIYPLMIYSSLWWPSKFIKKVWHMNWLWNLLSITSAKLQQSLPIMSQQSIHWIQCLIYVLSSEQSMLQLQWDF